MKITKAQQELLDLLARGPRYGFTSMRLVNPLVEKGLARKVGDDVKITAKGKKYAAPPRKFDQSTSQDTPGFVETFRCVP